MQVFLAAAELPCKLYVLKPQPFLILMMSARILSNNQIKEIILILLCKTAWNFADIAKTSIAEEKLMLM